MEKYLLWDSKYMETILAQEVSKYKVFGRVPKANIVSACLHTFVGIYLWPLEAGYWLWHTFDVIPYIRCTLSSPHFQLGWKTNLQFQAFLQGLQSEIHFIFI